MTNDKILFWKGTPIQFIDPDLDQKYGRECAVHEVINLLIAEGFSTICSINPKEAYLSFVAHTNTSCILINWELNGSSSKFIHQIRKRNALIPIFIMTEKHALQEISPDLLQEVSGYIWKMEDTPHFIAGRIKEAAKNYIESLMPPFFKELVAYTQQYKYAWHTPGHMGGLAFLKSPAGRIFYDFFGENIFRADLSVSVPELGSLLEHSGVNKEAENFAAKIFGADHTFFVTNGTSTANKIVNHGCIKRKDTILLDRNCHKSLQHAITMTGARPIYFIPERNALGIIGGITYKQFSHKDVQKKLKTSLLHKTSRKKIPLAVITNSTYDGLIYQVEEIEKLVEPHVENLHFDEAWFAYAAFHPLYQKRYAMHEKKALCNVFATHSTHKLLAAFSQASMIHVKEGQNTFSFDLFNEAFMMHTSTSPQYGIIASLDIATKMMQGPFGKALLDESLEEAIVFRKKMAEIQKKNPWWFSLWQPKTYKKKSFETLNTKFLMQSSDFWRLRKKDSWHGFKNLDDKMMMLDPLKVTLVTPGIRENGHMEKRGIPAPIVARFLKNRGIVDEKTGFYTFLFLFSIGVTKGKSSLLIKSLFEFKKAYDQNLPCSELFPDLVKEYPETYQQQNLQDLCDQMHTFLKKKEIAILSQKVFETLPDPIMDPYETYEKILSKDIELIEIAKLEGRILARMLVPYPPGIPLIMPGEKITRKTRPILEYLKLFEQFDETFPGFETETHGIERNLQNKYYAYCIK